MLTEEQRDKLDEALYALRMRVECGVTFRAEERAVVSLVESFFDFLRSRDPKVELPAHGQAVRFYAGGEGGQRHGTFSAQAPGFYERGRGLWKLEDVESWRPAEPQWRPKE